MLWVHVYICTACLPAALWHQNGWILGTVVIHSYELHAGNQTRLLWKGSSALNCWASLQPQGISYLLPFGLLRHRISCTGCWLCVILLHHPSWCWAHNCLTLKLFWSVFYVSFVLFKNLFSFEKGSHFVDQAALELMEIHLPQPPKFWD